MTIGEVKLYMVAINNILTSDIHWFEHIDVYANHISLSKLISHISDTWIVFLVYFSLNDPMF